MQCLVVRRRERQLHAVIKHPKIISVDPFDAAAEIVHRKIAEHRNRSALERLETDQRKIRILRAGLTGDIIPVAARVHRCAHGGIAKRIIAHTIRPDHPATQRGEFVRIKNRRTHLCRFQVFLRSGHRLDNFALQQHRIARIRASSQRSHARGGRVRVRGADELLGGANACVFVHRHLHVI